MSGRRRVGQDLIWALAVAVAIGLATQATQLQLRVMAVALGGMLGIIYSERGWLLGWMRNITRAARVLFMQEQNPSYYVHPTIRDVQLFPGQSTAEHDIDRIDYIEITIIWDNDLFRSTIVSDIRGTVGINAIEPPAPLPPDVRDELLQAIDTTRSPKPLKLALSGEALQAIRNVRRNKAGDVGLTINLRVKLNGNDVTYQGLSHRAFYRS